MMETRIRIAVAALLLLTGWLVGGCVQSVNTPTRVAPSTVPVLVRVLTMGSHAQLADVLVNVDGVCQGETGVAGELEVRVPIGVETTIAVSRAGYRDFWVAGTVTAAGERWTFYLEAL